MPDIKEIIKALNSEKATKLFTRLYGDKQDLLEYQIRRYHNLIQQFMELFPEKNEIELFSTPGRTEIGGNHTDHNGGRVLAAAVDLDIIAVVSANSDRVIRLKSEGFPVDIVDIGRLVPLAEEKYTSAALIRGVCARMRELGFVIGGFDAYTTSRVPKGSGLSSSAAFEVLVITIMSHLYNQGQVKDIQNAQIAQYAENNFFGKPCGLMDQSTCVTGGFVTIDFKDFNVPYIRKVDFDFSNNGFSLVITDTGGNHTDLNEDYFYLEHEMKEVARALGGSVLREFHKEMVLDNIAFLRSKVSDRAILRAIHFFDDDQRVIDQVSALESRNFNMFLELIIKSGYSSWMLCQNCYSGKAPEHQGISMALAVSENILKERGAWRVHGGGFAGTIQAFVPDDLLSYYFEKMTSVFGNDACHVLTIRPDGTKKLDIV